MTSLLWLFKSTTDVLLKYLYVIDDTYLMTLSIELKDFTLWLFCSISLRFSRKNSDFLSNNNLIHNTHILIFYKKEKYIYLRNAKLNKTILFFNFISQFWNII